MLGTHSRPVPPDYSSSVTDKSGKVCHFLETGIDLFLAKETISGNLDFSLPLYHMS
jgi:hypothetical protein